MNIAKQKRNISRRQRLFENIDNFEQAFKKFIALPKEQMIIRHFDTKRESIEGLGYNGSFRLDFYIMTRIVEYYKTGIVGYDVKNVVPCDEIYNRLVLMGFTSFDLLQEQQGVVRQKMGLKPFSVEEFIVAYDKYLKYKEEYESLRKIKSSEEIRQEYLTTNQDLNIKESKRLFDYPRSFTGDLSNLRRAYWYGSSESAEIDNFMKKEENVKRLINSNVDLTYHFIDENVKFNGDKYAEALVLYYKRYGNVDVPITYNFEKSRSELNYCGDLGAHHALVLSTLSGKVQDEKVLKEINKSKAQKVLYAFNIKADEEPETVPFDCEEFKKAFKAFWQKYKTSEVGSAFNRERSMQEFSYPRSLFEDAYMVRSAYHKKAVADGNIAKAMKVKKNREDLKSAKFNFWTDDYSA